MRSWVAAPFALLVGGDWVERGLAWPAFSGAAMLLEKITDRGTPLSASGQRALPFGSARRAPKIYGAIGNLEVRLANNRADIRRAQRLRYEVFYNEMSATPSLTAQIRRRDQDAYDAICDHLLVIDKSAPGQGAQGRKIRKIHSQIHPSRL